MDNKGLVSVVIPVYNVENYLPMCLDTLCGQTYENLEIIIVDDQSPDGSGAIAERYAQKDRRISVLHIENRGAAGARNVALDRISGEYLLFVDSDDWLELHTVQTLLSVMQEHNADIVMSQFTDEYVGRSMPHSITDETRVYDTREALRAYLDHWEYPLLWNKLFRRSLLQDTRFVEGRCIDDEFFTYHLFARAGKTVVIPDCLYHYRQRRSGAMGNPEKRRQRARDQLTFVTRRYEDLAPLFPELQPRLLEHLCELCFHVMRTNADTPEYKAAKKLLWKFGKKALFAPISSNIKKSVISCLLRPPAPVPAAASEEAFVWYE